MDYILLETDGPFVKPVKPENISWNRWEKSGNTGMILPEVAKKIAEIKGMSAEDVMRITEENTRRVFGIAGR